MDELKHFVDVMSVSSGSIVCFDLFRESALNPIWTIYACTHNDCDDIIDVLAGFTIDKKLSFNEVLTTLVTSGRSVKVHAYYFKDLY